MIIKLFLLIALCCAALLSLRSDSRTVGPALRRLTVATLLGLGVLAVLFPAVVTLVANALGVGRGADLVLYLLVVVSLFTWISFYKRLKDLDERLVTLTRWIAINTEHQPRHSRGDLSDRVLSAESDASHADEVQ